jgi:hypothetical protein
VSVWRLLSLGGLRRAKCSSCGAAIGLSSMSSLLLMTVGTWFPVAGGLTGAIFAPGTSQTSTLIGGAVGLLLSGVLFAAVYFRGAKLTVT